MLKNRQIHLLLTLWLTGMALNGCQTGRSEFSYIDDYVLSEKAQMGRNIFNRYCYACHGVEADGRTAVSDALKQKLNPKPTNLRNPKALKYKRDEAISKIIINGIPGTSMIAMGPPDGILTLEQIDLLLIYLKEIRNAVYFR